MKKEKNKKKKNNEPEMENYLDVFLRNYNDVPGFNALIKIILYLLFVGILILSANMVNKNKKVPSDVLNNMSTTVIERVTYKDIVDTMILNGTTYSESITIGDSKYRIEGSVEDGKVNGTIESAEGIKKFIIDQGVLYENNINGLIENNELMNNLEFNFVNIFKLYEVLLENKSLKTSSENVLNYKYNYNNGIDYIINNQIENNSIKNIIINSENIEYIINVD